MDQTVEMALARRFMALPAEKAVRFLDGMRSEGIDPMLLPIPAAEPGTRTQCNASAAQQRLWFLWRMNPESPAYTLVRAVRLEGLLVRSALEQTFNALVARHEALRTTFILRDGRVTQRINAAAPMEIPLLDLSGATESADVREERAREFVISEEQRAFDLESGPLLRVSLVRLDERDHVLVVAIHHIASDGWSMGVLFDEITSFYDAFAAGRAAALRPLRIQYADFAEWQRKWLDAGELSRQIGYWQRRLGTDHPLLDLPADRARPAQPSLHGATFSFSIDASLTSALHVVARRFDVTLFVLLLAAFKAVLYRYTGAQDLRVGMPVANRNRVETEPLIGFFVNMQVIRSEPRGDMRFDQLLDAVRIAALEAQSCQDLPFDELVDALNPPRSLSHHPLFQVAHNHQWRRRRQRLPSRGLSISEFSYESRNTQFDLTLSTEASAESIDGDEVQASFIYSTDLFERLTIERLARHWTGILRIIARHPETPLRLLTLLDADERDRALAQGRPRSEFPGTTCLHTRFESHAATSPNAIAVTHDKRHVTYAELNARANQLAHHLLGGGLARETLVGICIERSVEMVVAILAVLKAGGAYVPLDPRYPVQRLQDTLKDGNIKWLLTTSSALEHLSPHSRMTPLLLDELDLSAGSTVDPGVPMHPANLAYVIYTSGSTGRPKGALLCHRNVTRLLDATQAWFEFGPADTWTLFHSYAFDFSVWELFGALCTGGRLVIVPQEISRSPQEFFALLRDQQVTVLNQTPSAFKQLMQAATDAVPADMALRVVIFGGEALDPCSLRPWIERFGDARPRLINMYGITETTVHVTYRPIIAADMDGQRSPIGACIVDLGLQVLDSDLNLVPSIAAGELYVAGAGLARGYLGRPALTCERFVADPFAASGERVYRTGDLVRSRDDGDLEYLGRVDQQVKLRGYRIELGEIEDCITRSGQVREVLVVADASGGEQDKRLIAYVVAHSGEDAAAPQWQEHLRTYLQRHLPEYMVPAHYVPLDRFPLNANGKIDRKVLPTPDRPLSAEGYEPPRDTVEARLAQIWSEILKVERVGRHDDFFVLGGHSLTATQAVVQISAALSIDLSVRTLFEASELQRFAERVRTHMVTAREARYPLVPQTRERPLPLSHAQQRLWFLWKLEPDTGAFNIPVAVHLTGSVDVNALEHSFNALVRRHEVLRTRFVEGSSSAVHQVVRAPYEITIEHLDLRAENDDRRLAVAKGRAEELLLVPFDLEHGPLLRVTLMKLDEQEHVLLVTMHHIVADGRSMSIVVQEFTEFYAALIARREPQLLALPIQYSDYAVWHREWVEQAELDRQLAYWKQQLQDNIEPLQLPASRPRPLVPDGRGACHPVTLGPQLAQRLRAVARRYQVTMFTVLLLALAVVSRHRSGQQRFLLGTNVENRPRAELASLVGFFVNQLVLKVDLVGAGSLEEALRGLHATVLGALDNQDLPFDRLVDALRPRRRQGHAPFFNIKLVYQQGAAALPTLPGLQLREVPLDRNAVELDLIVEFLESADALHLNLAYRVELFDQADIACFGEQLAAVLDCLAQHDNVGLDRLEQTVAELQRQRFVALQAERSARMRNVKLVSRRPAAADRSLATIRPYRQDNSLIALCTPAAPNVSLGPWAVQERRVLDETLARHGAILFRGFAVASPREFNECIDALGGAALEYRFRSSPRTQVDPALRVYTSTEYPAPERIFPHNENSYAAEFPLRLFFYCETPAAQGGETPIGDARAMLREIHPEVRERFTRKQVLYIRNFGDGLGLPWQDVFQTDKREEVEQYCAHGGIEVQWRSGGRLRTRRKGPAIVRHPHTGELSWFNHATFFNALTLPERARADLLREFAPDELPQNTFYGDGSPIEPDVIAHLQDVYRKAMVEFTWQQGDLLMIDNLSTAHARNAFSGSRRILVGMAGTGTSDELGLRPEESACR